MKFLEKEQIVKDVQKALGLAVDGVDGPTTWKAIRNMLVEPSDEPKNSSQELLSPKALKLILDYEVGGGESYYNKHLKKPCWPKGASGVTIGVGYDCGYNTKEQFSEDWSGKISQSDFNRLEKTLGYKGASASKILSSVADIQIPWQSALEVFKKNTVPRFIKMTLNAFPNADKLHPDAFGALVSLVFNRGSSLKGESRREMANIRELVQQKNYSAIAKEIRSMKRLWVGKGLDGLLRRRDEEAALIENCA
jgi:hypothetical protein